MPISAKISDVINRSPSSCGKKEGQVRFLPRRIAEGLVRCSRSKREPSASR